MTATKEETRVLGRAALLKTALTIAFVAVGFFYISGRVAEFKLLSRPSVTAIAVVVFGFVASVVFRSLYNYFTSRRLDADLTLPEAFMLSAVVTASNVLLPVNFGATFRAVYMKKVHAFPYSYFASSAALYFVITTLMMSLVGVALLLMIHAKLDYMRLDLLLALPAVALLTVLGLTLRRRTTADDRDDILSSFKSGYLELVQDRQLVYGCILVVTLNFLVASLVWVVALRDYAPNVAILEAVLFAASQVASGLINLTPGAAGFQEVVGMYVGKSFSMSAVELFAVLLWVRLIRTLAAIVLGLVCAIGLRMRSGKLPAN